MSTKLSEIQLMLLSGASQRDDLHLSVPIGAKLAQTLRAATKLLKAGLIKEVKARKDAPVWRRNADTGQAYAFKLTAAGARAIAANESNRVEKPAPQAPGGGAATNEATRTTSDAANIGWLRRTRLRRDGAGLTARRNKDRRGCRDARGRQRSDRR